MPQPQTAASDYFGNVKGTVQSFWHGLSITLSYLLRRPITTQYPDRTPLHVRDMLPPRYRGFLEVDPDICTGCQACERACPIACIQINLEKDPANPKQRVVTQFDIDEAKCMFCGLCVEPCPTGSIQHTREFEASQRSVRNLVFRWADPEKPFPVYKVAKGAEYYPRVPLGSLLRAQLAERPWDAAGPEYLPPPTPEEKAAEAKAAAEAEAKAKAAKTAAAAAAKPAVAKAAASTSTPTSTSTSTSSQKSTATTNGDATLTAPDPKVPVATPVQVVHQAVQAVAPAEPPVAATPDPGAAKPQKSDGQQV